MRILVVGEADEAAARAEALIRVCALPDLELIRVGDGTAPTAPLEALVVAGPVSEAFLRDSVIAHQVHARRLPLVVLADDWSPEVATLCQLNGARICRHLDGPEPLRVALRQAHQEVKRRGEAGEERRRELNDLIRATERVRLLVNLGVNDVLFILSVEGRRFRFEEINPAFTRTTGLSPEQVTGKWVDEVIPEPSLSLVLSNYREAIATRKTVRWDEVTEYPTGRKCGEVSVTPLFDMDGTCTTLVGIVHDVTEARWKAETIQRYADIVDAVEIGLSLWRVDPRDPDRIVLEAANPAADRIAGFKLGRQRGNTLLALFPELEATELPDLLRQVARMGGSRELQELRFGNAPGRTFWVKAFSLSTGAVGVAFEDITEQSRTRLLATAEKAVLELAVSGATLEQSLEELVRRMEPLADPAIASVLLLARDGKTLRHGAGSRLPEAYRHAIDGGAIGPTSGSCGAAAALRQRIIARDLDTDPRWELYRDVARKHGLRACWSTPIFATDGRVLGTFALYYRTPRAPEQAEIDLIDRATHIAGIVIQNHQLDQQLRELSSRIEDAREEERTGIARELHDELGQNLTVLKMDLAWLARRAASIAVAPETAERLSSSIALTEDLIHQVQRISTDLRPALLDDLGLVPALRWQTEEFQRRTHIHCDVQAEVADESLTRPVATTVFRVFQEALTNVVRHAHAHQVKVQVAMRTGALVLELRDDGDGIQPGDVQNPLSIGLLGMRERARRVGGTLEVAPVEPHGTRITLRVPVSMDVGPRGLQA